MYFYPAYACTVYSYRQTAPGERGSLFMNHCETRTIMPIRTTPMISIIIPVFNAEAYLPRCLRSLQEQENKNFEAILIDDGSTDRSAAVCRQFTETDPRFRLYQKENGGVSSARNTGLGYAQGEWLVFADADDWLSPDFLNITEEERHFDIIQKSYVKEFPEHTGKCYRIEKTRKIQSREELFRFFVNQRTSALWDKIISRRVAEHLFFDEHIHIGEDFLFHIALIQKARNYILSPVGCYHYSIHQDSSMQRIKKDPSTSIRHYAALIGLMRNVSEDHALFQSLVAQFNAIQLYRRRKFMNEEEKKKLRDLFRSVRKTDLRYLSPRRKLKFLLKKLKLTFFP